MAPTRVLRFARSDDASSFVLLQVASRGSRPLDLKLVGTEGEAPYVTSLKHDRVSSLKIKNCPASDVEWQSILESLLNLEPQPEIQATASVQSEESLTITVRKQIQGITQRLGDIKLKHARDEAIELFEWCGAAVEASAAGKETIVKLSARSNDAETMVKDLKSQLEELIQAKEEDETALLQKFRDLLNEKKVKIREQQQILASGSFNISRPGSSQQASQAPPSQPTRQAGKSRLAKRKAPASKTVEESDSGEAQEMDVDPKQEPEETDPGNSSEATASTAEDEEDEEPVEHERESKTAERVPTRRSTRQQSPPKNVEKPPPRRDLPFAKSKPAKPTPAPAAGDDETDSDDEL